MTGIFRMFLAGAVLAVCLATASSPNAALSDDASKIGEFLQDVSSTIHTGNSQGSGVVKTRNGVHYVLTAGHVVAPLRHTRQIVDPKTGSLRIKIEFDDATIVKEVYQDGRSVGMMSLEAEVIRYSDACNGEDLALLRLRKRDILAGTAKFWVADGPVPVGTELLHCGSLQGQMGSNSVTNGIVSQVGRVINGVVYDQSNCGAMPGSSGGGLFIKSDGRYMGMVVRGAGETFNLFVPIRRIKSWSKRVGVDFVIDDSIPVPEDKELRRIPVEEVSGEDPNRLQSTPAPPPARPGKGLLFPFLLRYLDD